jgi:ABC-type multidrug transport system fused ATPase/permease subunit
MKNKRWLAQVQANALTKSLQKQQTSQISAWIWPSRAVKIVAGTTAFVSVCLLLLGFGVILGFAETFQLSHSSHAVTIQDYFEASVIGIQFVVHNFAQAIKNIPWLDTPPQWRVMMSVCFLVGVLLIVFGRNRYLGNFFNRQINKANAWKSKISKTSIAQKMGGVLLFLVFILPIFWGVIMSLSYLLIAIVLLSLSLFPSIGINAAQKYADEYVYRPTSCVPHLTQREYKERYKSYEQFLGKGSTEKFATCVTVQSVDGRKIFKRTGRLVFSTSGAMVLYYPDTGKAERIPLVDMTVQTSLTDVAPLQAVTDLHHANSGK